MAIFRAILAIAICATSTMAMVFAYSWFHNHNGTSGFSWGHAKQFNYHPVLMVAAFVVCNPFALLFYRNFETVLSKPIRKGVHFLVQTTAVILSSVGLHAILENHKDSNKSNFNNMHGWVGIIGLSFFYLNYLIGACSFTPVGGPPNHVRASIMPFHVIFGIFAFMMTSAAVLTGIAEYAAFTSICAVKNTDYTYSDLSYTCRLSGGLVVTTCLTLGLTFMSLMLPAHKSLNVNAQEKDKLLN